MNKTKIFFVFLIFLIIINIFHPVYAAETIDDILNVAHDFIERGENSESPFNGDDIKESTDFLYNMFLWAGIAVAVIVGAILGIKYIFESVEGKAKVLQSLIPYVVGCVVIFGGFGIWKIAMNVFNELEEESDWLDQMQTYRQYDMHSFSGYTDKDCNYCPLHCDHELGENSFWYKDGDLDWYGECEICSADLTIICGGAPRLDKFYNIKGFTPEQYIEKYTKSHNWNNGVCSTCGIKCEHLLGDVGRIKVDDAKHKCAYCGLLENHVGMDSDGKCDKCGFQKNTNNGYTAGS